jgi:hypothetical protein
MNAPLKIWTYFKAPTCKLLFTLLSVLYVCLFLLWESDHFKAAEPKPSLVTLEKKWRDKACAIEVGLYINNFQQFSMQQNEFTFDGIIWFKFPAGTESMDTIEKFSIKNSIINNGGNLVYNEPPIVKLIGNNVLVSYHVLCSFKTNLVYKNFPIGNHMLNIQIQNKSVTPYEFYFVSKPENLVIDKDFSYILYDWKPITRTVETGYVTAQTNKNDPLAAISYPAALFSIEFGNTGYRNILTLYFPMLVLFLISLFCLLLETSDAGRLAYAATAIPLLVLFRMVIDAVSPRTSYPTHLDYIYYLLLALCLLIIMFQAFIMLVMHALEKSLETKKEIEKKLIIANDAMFYLILILLVVFTTYSYFR